MRGQLLRMCLFQSLNGLVVSLELSQLLLVLLHASVKTGLHLLDLTLVVGELGLVILVQLLLLRQQALLILLELFKAFLLFFNVLLFKLPNFRFPGFAFLRMRQCLFLPRDNTI